MYSKNLWGDEPALITTLDDIVGKTVVKAVKRSSKDGRVKLLQIAFSGYTYCVIVADNPSVDINLMDDTERAIPEAFRGGEVMYMYTMALRMGGLMEDPSWHYEYIRSVHAGGLEEAKDEWARLTGFDKKSDWDPTCRSYWGWSVVCLGTSDPSVVIEEVE